RPTPRPGKRRELLRQVRLAPDSRLPKLAARGRASTQNDARGLPDSGELGQARLGFARLNIGDRGTFSLFETDLGPQEQRPETEVGDRKHHIVIPVHVTVMQQMMPVQTEEDSGP